MRKILFFFFLIPLLCHGQNGVYGNDSDLYHREVTVKISRCFKTIVPTWNVADELRHYNNPNKNSSDTMFISTSHYQTLDSAWVVQGIDVEKNIYFSEIIRDMRLHFKTGEIIPMVLLLPERGGALYPRKEL